MARIEASTHIEAPPARVWEVLTNWERQAEWMVDAHDVRVVSDHRTGVGVVIDCPTDVLAGIVVTDRMKVTRWEQERVLEVTHLGRVIKGFGAFELHATDQGTHLVWWEEATAPLGGLGEAVAQVVVVPYVRRLFRRSLAGFKRVAEAP